MKRKDFEIKFYEGILKHRPNFVNVLVSLGDAYTKKGFYKEGLVLDSKMVTLRPEDPYANYNLACSLSLLKQLDKSLEALKRAILFGYDDFSYMMKDADLENLRKSPGFKDFYRKLQKMKL